MHDVTGDQLDHRHLDLFAVPVLCPPRHRRGVAYHRLEFLGGARRPIFLSEAQQHTDRHHHRNDDRPGQIATIGGQLHASQYQQHHDERVLERAQQLARPVWRLLVRNLVEAVPTQPGFNLTGVEPVATRIQLRQQLVGSLQRVLRSAHGHRRQRTSNRFSGSHDRREQLVMHGVFAVG